MKYKKIMILTIILAFLLAISAVSAADNATNEIVSVEDDNQEVSVGEMVSAGSFTDLQNIINNASEGSTLSLENDYVYDDDFDSEGISISKSLTIQGNGHTIDASKKSRIFMLTASNVVLTNLTIKNGYADNGGAIYVSGDSVGNVFDCSFVDSSASRYGGAIYKCGNVVNCSFDGNSADDFGGAIFECDNVLNCNFTNNKAGCAGAIYKCGNVVNCSFVGNSAEYGISAICNYKYGNVVNCSFVGNIVEFGSVIDNGHVLNCTFDSNGGSCVISYSDAINGSVINCSFIDNGWLDDIVSFSELNLLLPETGDVIILNTPAGERYSYEEKIVNCNIVNANIPEDYLNGYGSIELSSNELIVNAFLESNEDDNILETDEYTIKVNIAGKTYSPSSIESWSARFDLSDLIEGNYTANVYYCYSKYYKGYNYARSIVNITVPIIIKTKYDISSSDVIKYYGGDEKYSVVLTKDNEPLSNVNVKITVNGKTQTVKTDSKGQTTIDLDLPVGTYDVVTECEDVKFTSKATVKSTITASDVSGTYLNSKCMATFLDTAGNALASKQVAFKVGDKFYPATTNSNGVATANVDLGVGTYTVTAVNPVNNEQKEFKLVISKAASKIALASSQSGEVVTLTVALTPSAATGSVIFTVNGENKTTTIKSGKATLTLTDLKAGNYTVTAFYNGDNNLDASASNTISFSVSDVYPVLTAKGVTKTYGTATKLVVYLKDNKGNAIANANVNVDIKGKVTPITTNSNGQATMAIGQAPGTYYAKITYPEAKQVTAKIVVKKANPKLTAAKKTFKRTVKVKNYAVVLKTNKNKALKSVWVSLKVNKKTYKVKTNTKGQAIFKINNLAKKGIYKAVVKFVGNKYYNAKTVNTKITVR